MRNIIKNVAAKNAVPWGEIAEKIDENFSEVEANFVKGIKVDGHTITHKDENGVIDIGNLTDIYIIPYFTIHDIEQLYNGNLDEISYDFGSITEAAGSQKTICVWDSESRSGLSVASWGLFRTLEITSLRYYSVALDPEGILNRSHIQVTDIIAVGNHSPYITRFTLSDATNGRRVPVDRTLLEAAYLGAPVMIRTNPGYVTSTYTYAENPNETTYLHLEVSDRRQKYRLIFDSHEITPENGFINIPPIVEIIPVELSIVNSAGDSAQSVNNVIRIPDGFFRDNSVLYYTDNPQKVAILISNPITLLGLPLLENGKFIFPTPAQGTAVEYAIQFRAGAEVSWKITTTEGGMPSGYSYGKPISSIPVGINLMKITLFTYTDSKGNPITEYFSEIIQPNK